VHPRLSVSAISTMGWDMARDAQFYRETGITNVGLSLRKIEDCGWERASRLVKEAGLRVTNLLGLGFDLTDRVRWPAHQRRLVEAVSGAAEMGAESFVLTTGPAGSLSWEDAATELADALAPVLAEASRRGVPLALEHTNSLRVDVSFLHRLADAVDLARRLGTDVLLEINACWAERGLAETIAAGIDAIRLVQVSDFVIGTRATPERAVVGDGNIPMARIVGWLEQAGYRGVYDVELIGPRIEREGYPAAIARSLDAMAALLDGLQSQGKGSPA
jgi:sugar phosphate isomerase/epimerase